MNQSQIMGKRAVEKEKSELNHPEHIENIKQCSLIPTLLFHLMIKILSNSLKSWSIWSLGES